MKSYDAVVLAGGEGRRLGGVDKAAIEVGSESLLSRALSAVSTAESIVVVGPPRDLPSGVVAVREDPPGGGPVAAIAAAMAYVDQELVVVLACDMPMVSGATVDRLLSSIAEPNDGALLVDETGRRQPLCAVYSAAALRAALASLESVDGAAMRTLVGGTGVTSEVAADPGETADCDTWDDVHRSRVLLEEP